MEFTYAAMIDWSFLDENKNVKKFRNITEENVDDSTETLSIKSGETNIDVVNQWESTKTISQKIQENLKSVIDDGSRLSDNYQQKYKENFPEIKTAFNKISNIELTYYSNNEDICISKYSEIIMDVEEDLPVEPQLVKEKLGILQQQFKDAQDNEELGFEKKIENDKNEEKQETRIKTQVEENIQATIAGFNSINQGSARPRKVKQGESIKFSLTNLTKTDEEILLDSRIDNVNVKTGYTTTQTKLICMKYILNKYLGLSDAYSTQIQQKKK